MDITPPTIVIRHNRENLKKCSLRGLESRSDFRFYTYPTDLPTSLEGYILLALDAEPLTADDAGRGLCLLDATWRYATKMGEVLKAKGLLEGVVYRKLPDFCRTAYPRRQTDCSDPERGLASAEALYLAYHILGRSTEGLLENYYWREEFFKRNQGILPWLL
jgi:pre-rRNA-processing protein TSR3